MVAELLPTWPLKSSACYHFLKASEGFCYLGDCTVYESAYALRPLKKGLLGSEKEKRGAPPHTDLYRNGSHVAFSYFFLFEILTSQSVI